MTVPARPPAHQKNVWVAAGDGDLSRVRDLIESQSNSPNAPDAYSYTPMHAAASYGHIEVLQYLITQGGDVNVTDDEGDTPLYAVENIETARFLIQNGAMVDRTNNEGTSPIDHLSEDFPEVAQFLRSQSRLGPSPSSSELQQRAPRPSEHAQDIASDNLTSSLLQSFHQIMERAEAEGRDPDDDLRQAVSRTVLEGVLTGYELSEASATAADGERRAEDNEGDGSGSAGVKRPRTDDNNNV